MMIEVYKNAETGTLISWDTDYRSFVFRETPASFPEEICFIRATNNCLSNEEVQAITDFISKAVKDSHDYHLFLQSIHKGDSK